MRKWECDGFLDGWLVLFNTRCSRHSPWLGCQLDPKFSLACLTLNPITHAYSNTTQIGTSRINVHCIGIIFFLKMHSYYYLYARTYLKCLTSLKESH